jgi:hypothetical protein
MRASLGCRFVVVVGAMLVAAQVGLAQAQAAPGADVAKVGPQRVGFDADAYQQVRYVSARGSDTGGGSKDKPWKSLSHALEAIEDAGPQRRTAVCVSQSVFPAQSLRLKPYVDLLGGFSAKWERYTEKGVSVLDGERKGRVLIGADHAVVDGFTIRGGRFAGHGGAVLCDRTSPTLSNCVFEENATLEAPTYLRGVYHQVGTEGGAIACLKYASPKIVNNLFLRNSTAMGGGGAIGMRSDSVRPKEEVPGPFVSSNVFIGNRSGTADDNPDIKKRYRTSNGGAISLSNYLAEITNNLFLGNHAGGNGDAGGIYCEYEASPRIANNHFVGNTAEDDGAAIYSMKLSEPLIEANVFAGNKAGGTIRVSKQGRARIIGNLIYHNPAGGVYSGDSWALVEKNVIMSNGAAGWGHQIQVANYLRPPLVRNNVIRNNKGGEVRAEGPVPATLEDNNIQGGYEGKGNFDTAPKLLCQTRTLEFSFVPRSILGRTLVSTKERVDGSRVVGQVVRIGERWGIVGVPYEPDSALWLWGDVKSDATSLELLNTFLPVTQ